MEREDAFILLNSINEEILHQYTELLKIGELLCRNYESEKLKLPYHLNIIDELHINENGHSRILMRLFCYRNEKGEYEFLKSFIDYIQSNTHSGEFKRIKIENPSITQELQRIDLWVRDKSYALIFENKVYEAVDQDAQLHRYIEKTKDDGYNTNDIFVIYLPQNYHEPNEQSWGEYKKAFESRFAIIPFQDDIIRWLKEDVLPNIRYKDQYLFSAITQYIDYLEGLFSLRTINKQLNMNIQKIISDNFELQNCKSDKERYQLLQEKIEDFNKIINQMQQMQNSYYHELQKQYVSKWIPEVEKKYPQIEFCDFQGKECFGLCVAKEYSGRKIQLYIGYDGQLYCQAQFDNSLPHEERLIEDTPLHSLKDILPNKNEVCIWKYYNLFDFDGVFECFINTLERIIYF